jgi:HK97 family phage prohead protease
VSELIIERAAPALEPVGDGWTVYGRAVPYGIESRVRDGVNGPEYWEEFAEGAFARDVDRGGAWINLMVGHDGDDGERFLGRCIGLEEQGDGFYPTFRINRSHPAAEAARSGELRNWSVSARVYRSRVIRRGSREVVLRERLGCKHVAATAAPQYTGAGVLIARDHVLIPPEPTPALDRWRAKYLADR